jgi:ABC-type branched-subunit amino acid transport system substrate-binding protein
VSSRPPSRSSLLAATVIAVALGCAPPPVPREFVLGATLPLSGSEAATGEAMRRGYARAVDEVNRAGGIVFRGGVRVPVRLDVRDDRGEATRAERLASELLGGSAHLMLATPVAIRAVPQAVVAEQVGKPLVVNQQDGEGLPGPRAWWTVAVPASGDAEARAYATASAALRAAARVRSTDPGTLRQALER